MDVKSRMKNYALWVSIAALVGIILTNLGLFQRWGITSDSYNQVVNAILSLMVLMGIINNPTTANSGFLDDKKIQEVPQVINPTNITNNMK